MARWPGGLTGLPIARRAVDPAPSAPITTRAVNVSSRCTTPLSRTQRPFTVAAADTAVRAVGTAFTVRLRDSEQVDVLVAEGKVAVASEQVPDPPPQLAGLIAGMTDVPVVAVPTSAGHTDAFGGLGALMTMLNSAAPGVVVSTVDNGWSAGVFAARIARRTAR